MKTRIFLAALAVCALVAGTAFAADAPATETAPQVEDTLIQDLFAPEPLDLQSNPGCQGDPDPDCVCPTVYEPVCGCNGVTYSSSCFAQCDGVRRWTDGECV